jgi:hypothetical protein
VQGPSSWPTLIHTYLHTYIGKLYDVASQETVYFPSSYRCFALFKIASIRSPLILQSHHTYTFLFWVHFTKPRCFPFYLGLSSSLQFHIYFFPPSHHNMLLGSLPCSSEKAHLTASFPFLAWLTLRSWRWRRYVPPKRRTVSEIHCVTTQKTAFFIVTAVITQFLHIPISLRIHATEDWMWTEFSDLEFNQRFIPNHADIQRAWHMCTGLRRNKMVVSADAKLSLRLDFLDVAMTTEFRH